MSQQPENLNDWLSYLENLHTKEIDLGLERVLLVFRKLLPRNWHPRIITVAGTNGKGSTVRWIERLLHCAGRRTGAYLSPHITRFNERILLDGDEVTDQGLMEAFAAVEKARGKTSLTYFEFATLAALWLFHREKCEDLILEVGLGGRLDAVNIMDPHVAVITSIGLDHTEWLGDNREDIGYEKAGILRPGIDAVYGEPDPPTSIIQQAHAQKVNLRCWGRHFGTDGRGLIRLGGTGESDLSLIWPGQGLPSRSLVVALQVFRLLGYHPDPELLETASQSAPLPGRFETIREKPWIIADVGHNPHAAQWLAGELARRAPGRRVLAVYAALVDKDAVGVALALREQVHSWFLAGLGGARGRSGDELVEVLDKVLPPGTFQGYPTVADAVAAALQDAQPEDVMLIFGSFVTVSEAREFFKLDKP